MQDYKLTLNMSCHAWRAELNIAAVKKEEGRLAILYKFRDYLLSIDSKHSPTSGNQRKTRCLTNTCSIDMPFRWTLYQQQTSHHIYLSGILPAASLKLLPQPRLWPPLSSELKIPLITTVIPHLIMFTSLRFAWNIQSGGGGGGGGGYFKN